MLEKLKRRVPDEIDDTLLGNLIEQAGGMLLAYTGRSALPEALIPAQIELALVIYNRRGMEGESAHAEGSLSVSAESLPELIRRQANPYRLARAVEA